MAVDGVGVPPRDSARLTRRRGRARLAMQRPASPAARRWRPLLLLPALLLLVLVAGRAKRG